MVSRSLDQIRRRSRSARVLQMGGRIRTLIQDILEVSREVIRARRAIQMGGQRGEHNLRNIFAAESKLKELIDLESELADELASWRRSDFDSEDDYFAELQRMEDKVRRLIDVERRLVREIRGIMISECCRQDIPSDGAAAEAALIAGVSVNDTERRDPTLRTYS
ncbi:hypothetical protein IscW_ISCW021001 [Ixodes scapularis]|uniref:Uncharacterized protein n=1 Tax=Ixodes scapularis TaxID=6945 RepID=B7Q953_IXOSC|nr:hypothetical protein IscW_ISCW021001 [Ixodes scapularis]|eukprot:XP_002405611.1 hypothetical protein IscW_ISCW021001 [Ixodes scapularis]